MGLIEWARSAGATAIQAFGARSKRVQVVHTRDEYDQIRMSMRIQAPRDLIVGAGFTREMIRAARDAQMRGQFGPAKRLSIAQRTDDGLYAALRNRVSPTKGLPVELVAPNASARALRIRDEALAHFGQDGVAISRETVRNIHEDLADHGKAFATCTSTPRLDGTRVDCQVNYWPIEHTRWDSFDRCFKTRVEDGNEETICHGDGRWIEFSVCEKDSWLWGAVIATSAVWEDRAFGIRDRGRASTSHGNAKMIGQLPEGIPANSDEGRAYLLLLKTMHEQLPYGLEPAGAKTQMLVNTSTSWQIFQEIVKGRLGDGSRIYLGHDGSTSAIGGNYIKDGLLYGVTVNIVEEDLKAIETGLFEGVIVPWTAVNFGDSSLAPRRVYLMPDADADARDDSMMKRRKALHDDLAAARANGILVDQAYVDAVAKAYRLDPPQLAEKTPSGAEGEEPMAGGKGALTVPEARAAAAATAAPPGAPATAPTGSPGAIPVPPAPPTSSP